LDLVVRGPSAVDRAVSLGRLERRRVHLAFVAGGNDVVVTVEQNSRRARGRGDMTHQDRRDIRQIQSFNLNDRLAEQPCDQVVRQKKGVVDPPRD